ncbi:hypothetical protein BBF96_01105 [Anoxybacter fermentans]|uniref:Major facilitator superfamily (MFS) profile domain-containing protein n=2 Tax=Anoxybacter fermentans TaxID=1323375 RepID=A0A3S9T2L1_9FIRM|nr:hypothetical protein BBF96_01105 [Anoxybacter fermentans]
MILMLAGKLVSLFGTYIYSFAIGLYVLKVTGSGMNFATTLVFSMLPRVILGPFAGAIADHFNRKRMVIIMDFLSGIIVLALYGIAFYDSLRLSYIYTVAVLLSICNTFFNVALDASIPNLVDEKRLLKINSFNQSIMSLAQITGPMIGGLIYGLVDVKVFLVINGLSFIISAISEIFIDFELTADRGRDRKKEDITFLKKIINEMKEGFLYLKESKFLLTLLSFALFMNFLVNLGYAVSVPYIINKVIKLTPGQYGIISSTFSIGIFLGSLVLSILPEFKKKYKIMTISLSIFAVELVLTGIPGIPVLRFIDKYIFFIFYSTLAFLMGVKQAIINIPLQVEFQRQIPDKYRGRVFGLIQTTAMAITPLALILAGIFTEMIPVYILPITSGILLALLMVKFATNEDIKKL